MPQGKELRPDAHEIVNRDARTLGPANSAVCDVAILAEVNAIAHILDKSGATAAAIAVIEACGGRAESTKRDNGTTAWRVTGMTRKPQAHEAFSAINAQTAALAIPIAHVVAAAEESISGKADPVALYACQSCGTPKHALKEYDVLGVNEPMRSARGAWLRRRECKACQATRVAAEPGRRGGGVRRIQAILPTREAMTAERIAEVWAIDAETVAVFLVACSQPEDPDAAAADPDRVRAALRDAHAQASADAATRAIAAKRATIAALQAELAALGATDDPEPELGTETPEPEPTTEPEPETSPEPSRARVSA